MGTREVTTPQTVPVPTPRPATALPPLPAGFELETSTVRSSARAAPPLPPGFVLEGDAVAEKADDGGVVNWLTNVVKGAGEGAADLAGGLTTFGSVAGEALGDLVGRTARRIEEDRVAQGDKFPSFIREPSEGAKRWMNRTDEQIDVKSPAYTEGMALAKKLSDTDFGYEQNTGWEDFKQSPLKSFIPFALEQGLVSTPDMVAAVTVLPAYLMARTGEMGQERAQNNGMDEATVEDLVNVLPAAAASALLERFGTKGLAGPAAVTSVKQVPGAVLKSAAKEGVTEAGQEAVEYAGTNLGTEAGFDPAQALERAAAGAVGGIGFGGMARGVTSGVDLATGRGASPAAGVDQGATVETGEGVSPSAPVSQDGAGEMESPPPITSAPSMPSPEERAILRRASIVDEDIDIMSPEERQAEVKNAIAAGIKVNGAMVRAAEQYQPPAPVEYVRVEDDQAAAPAQGSEESAQAAPPTPEAQQAVPAPVPPPEPEIAPGIEQELAQAVADDPGMAARRLVDQFRNRPAPEPPTAQSRAQAMVASYDPKAGQDERADDVELPVNVPRTARNMVADFKSGAGTRQKPMPVRAAADFDPAGDIVNAEPSDAQKAAGNYQKYHAKLHGFDIAIENPQGSIRTGVDPQGREWQTTMPAHYGYIKRSTGADGDQVDVYVGPNPDSKRVYVVDQKDDAGRFDEHKTMMGFNSLSDARQAYASAFSDGRGSGRIGAITPMSVSEFRKWVREGDTSKPLRMGQKGRTDVRGFPVDAKGTVKKPDSLIEFLSRNGGVREDTGELTSLGLRDRKTGFVVGAGPVIRRNGMHPDKAREAAAEAGYLPDDSSLADFYDALDADARSGRQQFSRYDDDWAYAWREGQGMEARQAEEDAPNTAGAPASKDRRTDADKLREEIFTRLVDDGYAGRSGDEFSQRVAAYVLAGETYGDALLFAHDDLRPQEIADTPGMPDMPFFGDEDNAAFAGTTGTGSESAGRIDPARDDARGEGEAAGIGGPVTLRGEGADEGSREDGRRSDQQGASDGKPKNGLTTEPGADNLPQIVIPGAERISDRQMAERQAEKPMRSSKPQHAAGGMFDDGETSPQLFDKSGKEDREFSANPSGWGEVDGGATERPAMTEKQQKSAAEIVRRVAGLNEVEFKDRIDIPAGTKGMEAWGKGNESTTAGGFYSPGRDAITLALDSASDRVAYHESFHRLQNLFLTDRERQVLTRDADKLRQIIQTDGTYDPKRMSQKELEAESFAVFSRQLDTNQAKGLSLRGVIRSAWTKMATAIRRIRGASTFSDVFSEAQAGKTAQRKPSKPKSEGTQFSVVDRVPSTPSPSKPRNRFADRLAEVSKALAAKAKSKGGRFDRLTEGDAETFGDYSTRKVLDYLDPVLKMQQKVGANLNDLSDAYLTARLAEGTIRNELHLVDEKYVQPAILELAKVGATEHDLHNFLYAMHAPERNRVVGLRNEEGSDLYKAATDPTIRGASGMSTNEAKETLVNLAKDREKFLGIRRAAGHIRAMLDDGLKTQLRTGLINKQTYDRLTEQWQHYVPLRAESDLDGTGSSMPSKSRGFDVRGDEFKGATGRYTKADNVVVYAVNNAEQSIIRSEKNKAAQAALRFINQFDPEGESIAKVYWSDGPDKLDDITKAPPVYRRTLDKDGKVVNKRVNAFQMQDDVVATKIGGKTYYMKFADPKVGLALKKMTFSELGAVMKMIRTVSNWQSLINTRANPAFIPINFIRDVQTGATLALNKDFSVAEIAKMTASIPKAWGALWRDARGKAGDGKWDKIVKDFKEAGGKIRFDQYDTIEETAKRIQKDMQKTTSRGATGRIWHGFIDLIENLNDTIENGMRVAVYNAGVERGMTPKRAAFMARDLTVDFQKKGEITPHMNALYTFFNASVQGNYNFARALYRSKKIQAAMGGLIMAGFAQHVLNTALAGDDDDGENAYQKMLRNQPWLFERNIVLFLPDSKKYVMLPLGFGMNAFWHLGVQGGAVTTGDRGFLDSTLDSTRVAFDAFNPLGSGGWVSMALPSVIDPVWELGTNQNFAGNPIYPQENQFDQAPPPKSEQAFKSTSPVFRWGAEMLNKISGGDEILPGAVDVYPDSLEYLWGWFTGGVGRFASQTIESTQRAAEMKFEPKKTPFIRSFYGEVDDAGKRSEYFAQREKAQYVKGKLKEFEDSEDDDALADFEKEHKTEVEAIEAFDYAEKQRRKLNKQRRAIDRDKDMTDAEKKKELEAIDAEELEIMNDARKAFAEARKAE